MENSMEHELQEALSEFARHRDALLQAQQDMAALSVTVRSKDRAVEVTVGAGGELTALRFLNDKHKQMSGQKLAAAVLEAITAARTEMVARATERFDSVAGIGSGLATSGLEDLDLDGMLKSLGVEVPTDGGTRSGGSRG
ncbi:YbaB/EbfC family nucleoid-associated protein [Streptomyces sp. SAI-229]|jgi:DNA-binding protein YbaB|uniref:YbaB/EbfC family nucleoid-associated protein n=1 Tax=Streptomyces sp. SAI-229 TaxID=3377731 RepID=UPI003C7B210B